MDKNRLYQGLALPMIIIAVWWYAGRTGSIQHGLFPSVSEVWDAVTFLWQRGRLVSHFFVSMSRVLIGFAGAAVVGVPLGMALGWFPMLRPWVTPTLQFLRQIPPVAWIPLFILWFGIGESSKHAVIFYAAFFPILLNTSLGVEQIPRSLWEVGYLLRFSPLKTLMKLVVPGSAVAVITGLRLGMGLSWRALVAAEMLAASSGLGYLIMASRSLVRLDEMVVGMLLIGLTGVTIDWLFVLLQRRLLPWNYQLTGLERRSANIQSNSDKSSL